MKIIFFIIFLAGIGNTVLRTDIENPYTLYRIVAPIGLALLIFIRPFLFLKWLLIFIIFTIYNFALASFYGHGYDQFIPSAIHYFYISILLLLFIFMRDNYENFNEIFFKFISLFYIFLIINIIFEYIFGNFYPNLYEDTTGESFVRAFFWNQNDLAVVLCIFTWFALCLDRFSGAIRWTVILLTVGILYYNDSKSAMISLVFCSLPIYFIITFFLKNSLPKIVSLLIVSFFMILIGLIIFFIADIDFNFANQSYSLNSMIFDPLSKIISLEPSNEEWGSINNRRDAAIFNLIEYINSYGFGLGSGGSWLVLTLPQYWLGGAQSTHNALLQFIVDFGFPALFMWIFLTLWAFKTLVGHRIHEYDRLKVMAILSFPLLGLSQSGAILTNFFFWGCMFFIILLEDKNNHSFS